MSTTNKLALNKLALNKLALNKLALNKLALNKLALNKLALNKLALNDTGGIVGTEDGREVLHYVAQCALREGTALVADVNGVSYEFDGLLGLAPAWVDAPLTASAERLVSACLFAHVNAYGVSVSISVRSPPVLGADARERATYPVYEGTFYGSALGGGAGAIAAYACQGDRADLAGAHSADRADRACTDATPDCAIVAIGRCRDVCESRTADGGWSGCRGADGLVYAETVSAYLRADDPDGADQRCDDDDCVLAAGDGDAAILDCSHAGRCEAACADSAGCTVRAALAGDVTASARTGATAAIDCFEAGSCGMDCRDGSQCELDCQGATTCAASCDRGASCEIDCAGAGSCDAIACTGNAACLIACDDPETCGFSACHAQVQSCPGGVIVCGRACP